MIGLDNTFITAMAKLDDGFALADRIVLAARGGDERSLLTDMIEQAAGDPNMALSVIARLVSYLDGRSDEERAEAARGAGIPPALTSAELRTPSGLVLPA
jgi:hypothetical protein